MLDMDVLNYKEKPNLQIHFTYDNVDNLGPGKRFVIWVQGCKRRCPGCLAEKSWDLNGGQSELCEIIENSILDSDCAGITISGGEPILQWKELRKIIKNVKLSKPALTVLLYTGYSFEVELLPYIYTDDDEKKLTEFGVFFTQLDWWIDGEYKEALDDGKGLRGSSNQKAWRNIRMKDGSRKYFCKRIKDGLWETINEKRPIPFDPNHDPLKGFDTSPREAEIIIENSGTYLIGIPTQDKLAGFENLCRKGETVSSNQTNQRLSVQDRNMELSNNGYISKSTSNKVNSDLTALAASVSNLLKENNELLSENMTLKEQLKGKDSQIQTKENAISVFLKKQEELSAYRRKSFENLSHILTFCNGIMAVANARLKKLSQEAYDNAWDAIIASIENFIEDYGFVEIKPQSGDTLNLDEHIVDNPNPDNMNIVHELVVKGYKVDDITIIKAHIKLKQKPKPTAGIYHNFNGG